MAIGVTPDGINPNARINPTTERKLYAKVVDNVLNSRTYMARIMGMGKAFRGKTYDIPIKIVDSGLGEFFAGLENLSTAASDTLIELSFAQTAFAQPVVSIMLESFANSGPEQSIDLDVFKLEEAVMESIQALGSAIYDGTSAANEPLGLESHVDDGTTAGTIGGQSRTTYDVLNGTVTASGGTVSLAKLATLESAIAASGIASEYPSINLTTKTVWDLYERLLSPSVRADYASVGFNSIALRGNSIMKGRAELKGAAGFTAVSYRGIPVIADDACTSGVWYALNERYLEWRGRTSVPSKYSGQLSKVSLGVGKVTEGVGAQIKAPSSAGWFFQKQQMMPNQAGMIGRFYVIGQTVGSQPRRQGKLTGITGV